MNKIVRICVRDIRGIDFINLEITKAKIPQKMNKIVRICVRDIRGIDFINLEITQSVFKIFAWNFRNRL